MSIPNAILLNKIKKLECALAQLRRSPPPFDWRAALDRCVARRDKLSELDSDELLLVVIHVKLHRRVPTRAEMRLLRDLDHELRGGR